MTGKKVITEHDLKMALADGYLAGIESYKPVRNGRWILSGPDLHGNIRPKCSVCGKYRLAQWTDHIRCNYCPECGAKMQGAEDADD